MILKTNTKKYSNEKVKDELLNSPRENHEVEETEINIGNVTDPGEALGLINDRPWRSSRIDKPL